MKWVELLHTTMLIKRSDLLEVGQKIHIEKRIGTKNVSNLGAFRFGDRVTFAVTIPRRLGVSTVVIRITPDGSEPYDSPFAFSDTVGDLDRYSLTVDTAKLCNGRENGLFFYELLLLRGFDTLFTDSINNVDFKLSEASATPFHLLVYDRNFHTPAWFRGGIMYHIFLDRFCRGQGKVSLRRGATLNEDWEGGIPQYAKKVGDPLSNDVFFGGNLWGVIEKLDYLESLGVTTLYLSPIFASASNHRYDTADYERIDDLLGGRVAFDALIKAAHKRGMRVILDGVFNHTGDDSIYFNRRGNYASVGAYQSEDSPYADWFNFRSFPDDYESWWGIEIMPRLKHDRPECRAFFTGKDGIGAKWLRAGADGWRLDVADELSDEFLDEWNATVKHQTGGEGLIIGEVWENATTKISYGKRREYFRGHQLDSVMNYPFKNAVLALLTERDATAFYDILTEIYASYPPEVSNSLMNLVGTHDTERILTLLGDGGKGEGRDNDTLAKLRLSADERTRAKHLLKIASTLQFTAYGVPSVYYGDEVGVEGYHDPFCRLPFPWGREDAELLAHYRLLGKFRHRHKSLADGSFAFLAHTRHAVAYERTDKDDRTVVAVNMGQEPFSLPLVGSWRDALTGEIYRGSVAPDRVLLLEKTKAVHK